LFLEVTDPYNPSIHLIVVSAEKTWNDFTNWILKRRRQNIHCFVRWINRTISKDRCWVLQVHWASIFLHDHAYSSDFTQYYPKRTEVV
jgi:hypothetical protein